MKAARCHRAVILEADVLYFAAPVFRHLVEQETVDCATDAKCEDAGVWMFLHFGDDLHIVADIAVGHEAYDPHMLLRVGRIKSRPNGFHHLGPAAA